MISSLITTRLSFPNFQMSSVIRISTVRVVSINGLTTSSNGMVAYTTIFQVRVSVNACLSSRSQRFLPRTLTSRYLPFSCKSNGRPNIRVRTTLIAFVSNGLRNVMTQHLSQRSQRTSVPEFMVKEVSRNTASTNLSRCNISLYLLRTIRSLARFLLLLLNQMKQLKMKIEPISSTSNNRPCNSCLILKHRAIMCSTNPQRCLLLFECVTDLYEWGATWGRWGYVWFLRVLSV